MPGTFDPTTVSGNWNYPSPIRFGPGVVAQLPAACRELGMTGPLLVTDEGLASLSIVAEARACCEAAGLPTGLFSGVQGNPVGGNVGAGVAALQQGGHDGVIAFGGGSALDVGKAVGLMAHQRRPLWDFEDVGDNWKRVDVDAMVPVVAVPTTSGTGSEVGRCSVIIDEHKRKKIVLFHPKMLPERVVADPDLTLGLPPHITAAVGMDALSHNLEALCAPRFHPQADGIAKEGILLVHRALQRAVADGSDREARAWMMVASTSGAAAFQKGLGAMHSMSHPLGALLNAHHGLLNAIVMPYVLIYNRDLIAATMDDLSRTLELPGRGLDAVLQWVLDLRGDVGIPHTLEAVGLEQGQIPALAMAALVDPTAPTNPRPRDQSSVEDHVGKALYGDMG